MFYSLDRALSYNGLFTFIIGERGVGKSYSAKKFLIRDYLKNGNEFVYLRRYKSELKTSVPHFFDDIRKEFDEETTFKVSGDKFIINGETAGYAVPLSTANILKSTSFDKVKTIVFDEFILAKGTYHYLSGEVEALLDNVETIGRLRDIRVIFLANAVTIDNPYFAYFDISLPYGSNFKTFKDGLIVLEYIKNEEYRENKRKSRFGRLIDGTNYGKYAIDNEWLQDESSFIAKKKPTAKYWQTLKINGNRYGMWRDFKEGITYISSQYDPLSPLIFALTFGDHDEKTVLQQKKSHGIMKLLIQAYQSGTLRFENQKTKNDLMKVLRKTISLC